MNLFFLSQLQILGMGTKRLLTLTHRAQVKRFTQDLLKLLKFQASKQVAITDFMQAYHWSVLPQELPTPPLSQQIILSSQRV